MAVNKFRIHFLYLSEKRLSLKACIFSGKQMALVICGEKDAANKKASEELTERIRGASLRLIPGSGHEVNQQAPTQLAEILDDFWRD